MIQSCTFFVNSLYIKFLYWEYTLNVATLHSYDTNSKYLYISALHFQDTDTLYPKYIPHVSMLCKEDVDKTYSDGILNIRVTVLHFRNAWAKSVSKIHLSDAYTASSFYLILSV